MSGFAMVNKFGAARLYVDNPEISKPQEHVNLEMLKAIELLGKRLERTESERDRLAHRLAVIESAATVDEKTGKLYLPVVVDPRGAKQASSASRWTLGVSLMSSALALLAVGLSLHRGPEVPQLTPQQLAALNALAGPMRMVDANTSGWKQIDEVDGVAETKTAAEPVPETAPPVKVAQLPSHLWSETFGPPQPPVAEVSDGWRVASTHHAEKEIAKVAAVPPAPVHPAAVEPAAVEPAAGATDSDQDAAPATAEATPAPAVETPAPKIAEATKPVEKPLDLTAPPASAPAAAVADAQQDEPAPQSAEKAAQIDINPDPALPAALASLEKRAFSGSPEAQHDLATLYAAGKAVPQDYKRAAYWFYKAADGGIANADYNLGVMFQQGMGVRKDVNKALGWYEKAAQLGHPEAMYNLGIAYVEGVGTARNVDRGVSYFKKAANAGVAQAAYNLGVLYESNFVGPINLAKAEEWYQVAADEGHASAKDAVARLRQQIAIADKTGEEGAKVAAKVEPASGGKDDAEYGEGDSTPISEGSLLARVQAALITHGDLTGAPSGVMDDKTGDAIRAWQKKLGMPVTGQPTADLLNSLQDVNAGK